MTNNHQPPHLTALGRHEAADVLLRRHHQVKPPAATSGGSAAARCQQAAPPPAGCSRTVAALKRSARSLACPPAQDVGALLARPPPPLLELRLRGGDGQPRLGAAAVGHARDGLAGGGVHHLRQQALDRLAGVRSSSVRRRRRRRQWAAAESYLDCLPALRVDPLPSHIAARLEQAWVAEFQGCAEGPRCPCSPRCLRSQPQAACCRRDHQAPHSGCPSARTVCCRNPWGACFAKLPRIEDSGAQGG